MSNLNQGMRLAVCMVAASTCVWPVLAQTNTADDVFNKAKALEVEVAEQPGPAYTYDIEMDVEGTRVTGSVNMAAEPGQRLVVHTPVADQWSDEFTAEVADFEKNLGEDTWCQNLMEDVGDYSAATETADAIEYEVALKYDPKEKEEVKFAKNVDVLVTLSKEDGAVLRYSMHAPKPFRPVMIAKIKKFEFELECDRAPDGRTYAKMMRSDIQGRAMMKNFHEKEMRTLSNMRLP